MMRTLESFAIGVVSGVLVVAAACNGCAHHVLTIDPPPPVPSGSPDDVCARACAVLARYCEDGRAPNCADACRTDQAQGVGAQLRPACVVDAGSLEAVRACGACL